MTATPCYRVRLFAEPLLEGPDGPCPLSPFQSALLAVVFGEQRISRDEVANLLWRGDARTKTRPRIRQLKNEIRRRSGSHVLEADGDLLVAGSDVECDLEDIGERIATGGLADAASMVIDGLACAKLLGISDELDDWTENLCAELRKRIAVHARGRWQASRTKADWPAARDAAEALYVLDPASPNAVASVIEARARVGRLHAAEVAYADFRERWPESRGSEAVEEVIRRVRALGNEQTVRAAPRVPFVGRREALAELTSIFEDVRAGIFSFALVSGEAGIGKTRLIREVERAARLDGFRCLAAEPVELERRISMNPIIDALSDIDLEPHLDAIGDPWRTVIGTMLPPGPHAEPVQALPPIEDKSLSRRLLDAFSLLFRSIADEQPTIFFLDDIQWADATTIAALQFYQRRWSRSYFGIVATVRPTLVGRKDPAFPYLEDDKLGVHRLSLEELSEGEARQLVASLGDEEMDTSAANKLLALSGRHPLYLTELTRDYLSGRLALPESEADAFGIPISLKQILAARVATISGHARSVLHTLAVASKPMRLSELGEILDLSLDLAADAAEELQSRQLIELDRDRIWMAHDVFRAATYRQLSEAHRAVIHHRLAIHIRANSGDEVASELATHFDRAGRGKLSAKYGWTAAGRAFERGAVAEAAYFYELVTRNEPDEARRADATAKLATSLHLNRDMSRANPALELASRRLRAAGMTEEARRIDIRRVEGLAEVGDTPVDELVERLAAIKDECLAAEDWEGAALALDTELGLQHSAGDLAGISKTFAEMRALAGFGPPEAQAVCHLGLAMGVLFGDPDEALASAEEAVRLTETVRVHRLKALLRLMVALQLRGRLHQPRAEPIIEEAQRLAQRSGDIRLRFSVASNLAVAELDAGELERAHEQLDQSTQLLGSAEMDLPRFNQANNYAELALARGDYQLARRHFAEASCYLGPTTPPYAADLVDAGIGLCALESGNIREAQRREELLRAPQPPWYFDPSTLVAFQTRLLELRGSHEIAEELLETTAEDLDGRLELAWLKTTKLRIEKAIKWGRTQRTEALTARCIDLCEGLGLMRRRLQFETLFKRLRSGPVR